VGDWQPAKVPEAVVNENGDDEVGQKPMKMTKTEV
jgi:hypothetical protein